MREHYGQLLLVSQPDHAELSAQFAAHWGNEKFAKPEPFEQVIVGTADHDNGWKEQDNRPILDVSKGLPYQFYALPYTEHTKLFWRGINRAVDHDPYVGLMVCMHGTGLYKQRYGVEPTMVRKASSLEEEMAINGLIEGGEKLQKELRERLVIMPEYRVYAGDSWIWTNYRMLQAWDRLSLYFCWKGLINWKLEHIPMNYEGEETTFTLTPAGESQAKIAPYPFERAPMRISMRGRLVPKLFYEDEHHFRSVYYKADRIELPFELVPGD